MKLIKDLTASDYDIKFSALDVMNRLKAGDRVFGNPGQGLKITMKKIEDTIDKMEAEKDALSYIDNTGELRSQVALLKAGITGEENLSEFLEIAIKKDKLLQDCVVFASLSDPEQNSGGEDYISDSDFIIVYGKHALIVDAKNVNTTPDIPIYLNEGELVSAAGASIMEIHPSVYVWNKIFKKYNVEMESIHGCTVIVNKKGALIWRNAEWHSSETKPMHISEFIEFLHDWIDGKENSVSLKSLATIANMQIKEDTAGMDFTYARRTFNL